MNQGTTPPNPTPGQTQIATVVLNPVGFTGTESVGGGFEGLDGIYSFFAANYVGFVEEELAEMDDLQRWPAMLAAGPIDPTEGPFG